MAYENRNSELRNWNDKEEPLSPRVTGSYIGKYRTPACMEVIKENEEWKCISPSWSNVEISRKNDESAFFTIKTRKPGGGCALSGIARIREEFLIGSGKANFGEGVCIPTLKLQCDSLFIEKEDDMCEKIPLRDYGDTFSEGKTYKKY